MPRAHGSVLRQGVVAGFIGAAVVAVWFLSLDLARQAPVTPALLGAAVFHGLTAPADLVISAGWLA